MSTHKYFDKICCVVLALTLVLTVLFVNGEKLGVQKASTEAGYEKTLFDSSRVHTIDIIMNDWDEFTSNARSEEYYTCTVVIDNEAFKNVAIRGKGNTSLSSVTNDRYSYKIEFDHYDSSNTYYGLDKLCLNNIIQDNTYMKDFLTYTMMNDMGVASPLCSYAYITVNGEDWGLYLAVEGVEESFLQRNYGKDYGELYKPDSMSMGGGRGNGNGFDMDEFMQGSDKVNNSVGNKDKNENSDAPVISPEEMTTLLPEEETTIFQEETTIFQEETTQGVEDVTQQEENSTLPDIENMPEGQFPDGMTPPDFSGENPFGDMTPPDFSGENPFGGMTPPDFSGENPFGDMTPPDFSGENPFGDMTPPDFSGENPFGDMTPPDFSGENPFGDMTPPDFSGENPFGGMTPPDFSGENPFSGMTPPDFSGENPFGDMIPPDFSGENPFGGMGSSDVKLQYIDDDPDSYSNIFDNAKTDITKADKNRLIESLKNLGNYENLEATVDIEAVIRYFSVHNFVVNSDSYTGSMIHNYYLYEKDGQLQMIPWDYNLAFGSFMSMGSATSSVNDPIDTPLSVNGSGDRPMIDWIFSSEEYKALYHQALSEFIETYFDSGYFTELIDSVRTMISPYVEKDPTKFCTYEEFEAGISTLKDFCLLRAESVKGQLNGTIGSTSATQEAETLIDAGALDISTMGTMGGMGGGMNMPGGDMQRPQGNNSGEVGNGSAGDDFSNGDEAMGNINGENNQRPQFSGGQGEIPSDFFSDKNGFGNSFGRPAGDMPQNMAGQSFGQTAISSDSFISIALSLAVLVIGLIFVLNFRRRK